MVSIIIFTHFALSMLLFVFPIIYWQTWFLLGYRIIISNYSFTLKNLWFSQISSKYYLWYACCIFLVFFSLCMLFHNALVINSAKWYCRHVICDCCQGLLLRTSNLYNACLLVLNWIFSLPKLCPLTNFYIWWSMVSFIVHQRFVVHWEFTQKIYCNVVSFTCGWKFLYIYSIYSGSYYIIIIVCNLLWYSFVIHFFVSGALCSCFILQISTTTQ